MVEVNTKVVEVNTKLGEINTKVVEANAKVEEINTKSFTASIIDPTPLKVKLRWKV